MKFATYDNIPHYIKMLKLKDVKDLKKVINI